MYPDSPFKQRGFSMPIVVFVLVIMALLAAGIAQLSSRSNISAAQEELSNRAFYAAESGAQWAMSRLFFRTGVSADRAFSDLACDDLGAMPDISTVTGLATCAISVNCDCPAVGGDCALQAVGETNYYRVVSTGSCGTGQMLGIRTVEVRAKNGG